MSGAWVLEPESLESPRERISEKGRAIIQIYAVDAATKSGPQGELRGSGEVSTGPQGTLSVEVSSEPQKTIRGSGKVAIGPQGTLIIFRLGRFYPNPSCPSFSLSCKGLPSSQGGMTCRRYVWSGIYNRNERSSGGFRQDPPPGKNPSPEDRPDVYALDCEMGFTVRGLELLKVTVITQDGSVKYESLVQPEAEIVDYNTRFYQSSKIMLFKYVFIICHVAHIIYYGFSKISPETDFVPVPVLVTFLKTFHIKTLSPSSLRLYSCELHNCLKTYLVKPSDLIEL
ncbi:hypothetical protein J6590_074485, partial [Homalodisca vitripennis]